MNAQHSAASVEHYTPVEIIEAARATMGGIDLDPASTLSVNAARVRAGAIFTRADDGLSKEWRGRVWLNPPGGRIGNRSSAAMWWRKLCQEWWLGRVPQAVFLGFSVEILATTQGPEEMWIGNAPFCIPRKRISFLQESSPGVFEPGESPTHSNIIAYLPSKDEDVARFEAAFSTFGMVRT